MSLRTRLLLSYALVIFVCIAIIFVALLFLLRDAPVQKRLTTARLTVEASVINRLIRVPLQNGATPDQIMSRLQVASQNNDVRILLINDQSGQILADTDNSLTGRNLYQLGRPQRLNSATTGEFDSGGMHWLYSTRQVLGPRNNIEAVVTVPYEAIPPFSDPILRELLQPLLIALVLAFAVSIVLAILVTRSVTRPMQHVALAAQKIAAGEYNQAVPVEGPGEVKEMATNFNQMAQKVRDTQQIQRDFLANVSHELKTPLTSIQGFAQAIKDGTASDDEAIRKSGAIIFDEATRMTRMVGELLDLARMESGQIVMRSESVQIDHVLRNVVEHMAMRAQTDGIHLQSEIADGLPPISGDGDRLSQVFNNLVDNALKHTPAGGTVTVTARSSSGPLAAKKGKVTTSGLEVSVVDTGSGIPPQDLPHIFERFYQVDKSRARSKSSSSLGLGLAIVREIVAAHGGTIHAESVVGLGTKFVIWLPIERGKIA